MTDSNESTHDDDRLLVNSTEAARMLSVCPRTIANLTASGQIRVVRIGRSVRFSIADLTDFVEGRSALQSTDGCDNGSAKKVADGGVNP